MPNAGDAALERYETARNGVVAELQTLEELLPENARSDVRFARERLARGTFVLAVVGEFSSGKSFLLNALLGRFGYQPTPSGKRIAGLLATDINPSTASITELTYSAEEAAYAHREDGTSERVAFDRLSQFIAVAGNEAGAVHDATKDDASAPVRVEVRLNSPFLQRGFTVADTPGLASINPAHRRATLRFLPSADAVLYLIDTQQPFTEGDASFLGIVREHIRSIFIVQTKIDLWNRAGADGIPEWQRAHERIVQLSAVHSPETYVFPLSAKQYVEGVLDDSPETVAASRFEPFLAALDATLIGRTGRARLERAAVTARTVAEDASQDAERDLRMLALTPQERAAERARLVPQLEALEGKMRQERADLLGHAEARKLRILAQGRALADDLEQSLAQAFDATDIARLRDRGRLHVLVDRTTARVMGEFAREIAADVMGEIETALRRINLATGLHFSAAEAAARAFGADGSASIWSGDIRSALAATIVLDAIGGLAAELAHDIAARFAAAPAGSYMKRELGADLRSEIFPRLHKRVLDFASGVARGVAAIYETLGSEAEAASARARARTLGSVDRALESQSQPDAFERMESVRATRQAVEAAIERIDGYLATFDATGGEAALPDAGSETVRRAHVDVSFDRDAYDRGLRPQRWRVAVLGAMRRGKSALINAVAGTRVLGDESPGELGFPVHVRYGAHEQAFSLQATGEWRDIEIESATSEATRNPVLILTPWKLPHELVLVHVPAFDAGDPAAEDVAMVAAGAASEVLCLFSRQLSDRELALYERIAELGKPTIFAHTIADNETDSERRHVVELARRYLEARNIQVSRIFTISTFEYAQARREGRAPAGWNELDALVATLEAHAEAHMARLGRLQRASAISTPSAPTKPKPGFFKRLLGKGR